MQYIGSLEAAEKHISEKIFKKNLHTSVKDLQICMDLQDSVQRSLRNPADLQRFAKIENLGSYKITTNCSNLVDNNYLAMSTFSAQAGAPRIRELDGQTHLYGFLKLR